MELLDNVNKTLKADPVKEMKEGSKISIAGEKKATEKSDRKNENSILKCNNIV